MPHPYHLLTHDDYLRVVRLAADVAVEADAGRRREGIAKGAVEMTGGQSALAVVGEARGGKLKCAAENLSQLGWARPDDLSELFTFGKYRNNPVIEPVFRHEADCCWRAADRREFFTETQWQRFPFVQTVARGLDVGPSLYAWCNLGVDHQTLVMSIHRPWNERRQFHRRDVQRLELLMEMAHRLGKALLPPDADETTLGPRLQQTLRGLLAGRSEKEIAAELGVRPATVHHYVFELYRHFRVHSARELLALLLGHKQG